MNEFKQALKAYKQAIWAYFLCPDNEPVLIERAKKAVIDMYAIVNSYHELLIKENESLKEELETLRKEMTSEYKTQVTIITAPENEEGDACAGCIFTGKGDGYCYIKEKMVALGFPHCSSGHIYKLQEEVAEPAPIDVDKVLEQARHIRSLGNGFGAKEAMEELAAMLNAAPKPEEV